MTQYSLSRYESFFVLLLPLFAARVKESHSLIYPRFLDQPFFFYIILSLIYLLFYFTPSTHALDFLSLHHHHEKALTTFVIMDAAPIAEGPQWVDQFLEEFPIEDCDPVDKTIAETLKHYLLSNGKITAAETARQIDRCFQHDWLNGVPDHPEDFIQDFYDIVFCLAKVVPHNDPKQDRLIQVILELRKLPAKQFQIWEVRFHTLAAVQIQLRMLTYSAGG